MEINVTQNQFYQEIKPGLKKLGSMITHKPLRVESGDKDDIRIS